MRRAVAPPVGSAAATAFRCTCRCAAMPPVTRARFPTTNVVVVSVVGWDDAERLLGCACRVVGVEVGCVEDDRAAVLPRELLVVVCSALVRAGCLLPVVLRVFSSRDCPMSSLEFTLSLSLLLAFVPARRRFGGIIGT